ncbi:MAG: DinB family protein [Acidobacteria bacterium]|nr:DinB family protein [Acidobacteriota bacterium]
MESVAKELKSLLETEGRRLRAISEAESLKRSGPEKWSKKEIIGHLIDSAANNHQRFVRMQLAPRLEAPGYQQEEWVRFQHYHDRPWLDVIELWLIYNRHLAHVIRHCDPAALKNKWRSPDDGDVDLEFVIRDYVKHMRHHLAQI